MSIDERALLGLIEESQDLQSDALKASKAALPELREIGAERRRHEPDPERISAINSERRKLLKTTGLTATGLAARGLFVGGFGAALAGIVARPVAAQSNADVAILQTAASLENLAVATYQAALGLPFIANGNKVIITFAETTQSQHAEHGEAFNSQAEALGGERQTLPNPVYEKTVKEAMPGLTDPTAVVELAATLEEVATDTYLANLALLEDARSRELTVQVMGVESQHLATLRAVAALLAGGAPELIAIPTDLAALPAQAGSASFEGAFEEAEPKFVADPQSGAVK